MHKPEECGFGQDIDNLKQSCPGYKGKCVRWVFQNDSCVAVLDPNQYTIGHTIVIVKSHRDDIADDTITEKEKHDFISAIHEVSKILISGVTNERRKHPERIYVASLSDGVKHLHAHLIPRYPFTKTDEKAYSTYFLLRDGELSIENKFRSGDLGGFWYVTEREKIYYKTKYWRQSIEKRAKSLNNLAARLRKRSK